MALPRRTDADEGGLRFNLLCFGLFSLFCDHVLVSGKSAINSVTTSSGGMPLVFEASDDIRRALGRAAGWRSPSLDIIV